MYKFMINYVHGNLCATCKKHVPASSTYNWLPSRSQTEKGSVRSHTEEQYMRCGTVEMEKGGGKGGTAITKLMFKTDGMIRPRQSGGNQHTFIRGEKLKGEAILQQVEARVHNEYSLCTLDTGIPYLFEWTPHPV